MEFTSQDIKYMRRAIRLGAKGKGSTFPNPPVGAVLVKDGCVIGEGWHRYKGESHAEIHAIVNAKKHGAIINGATLYVTLEPCCHHGATPPCVEAIIAAGISKVYIANIDDYDAHMCGTGISRLETAGIEVFPGLMEDKGRELIEHYIVQRVEHRAFLTAKWAQSLDGLIATSSGDSKWISGESARKVAHKLRSEHCAVAVGANTVFSDDPKLTVRNVKSHHNPVRIILAGARELPVDLNIFTPGAKIIIVHSGEFKLDAEPKTDVEFIEIRRDEDFWDELLAELPKRGIGSVLLEGGGKVITSALKAGAVDRVCCIIAPIIIGEGIEAVGDIGTDSVADALKLWDVRREYLGQDILITGKLRGYSG